MEQPTSLQIIAATNNEHKLSEIRPLIGPDLRILSLRDIGCDKDLPETADTLEGNSLQKAQYVFDHYGLPCFADDTGLEVESLNGAPGVHSARYAGEQRNSEDNIDLLLRNLTNQASRRARFRTVITLLGFGEPVFFQGIVSGVILDKRHGSGGFGYDPVFQPDGFSKTLAQMTMEEKNRISHRGQAVQRLVAYLNNRPVS